MDEIIKWTGWIAAVGIVIYEVVKQYRNRRIIKVKIWTSNPIFENGNWTKYLNIQINNHGKRPVNVIRNGFIYNNGVRHCFETTHDESQTFLIYNDIPRSYCYSFSILKQQMTMHNTDIVKVFVQEESGNEYDFNIPEKIRKELISYYNDM